MVGRPLTIDGDDASARNGPRVTRELAEISTNENSGAGWNGNDEETYKCRVDCCCPTRSDRRPRSLFHFLILARLRTYPQHTLSLLPLLRSRPGGVHKASVVRSPGSDNSFPIGNWQLPIGNT